MSNGSQLLLAVVVAIVLVAVSASPERMQFPSRWASQELSAQWTARTLADWTRRQLPLVGDAGSTSKPSSSPYGSLQAADRLAISTPAVSAAAPESTPAPKSTPAPAAPVAPTLEVRPSPVESTSSATATAPAAPPTPLASFPSVAGGVNGTFFVSPDGSDSASGTWDRPFGTVNHGLSQIGAGQVLYLRGGTYVEDIEADLSAGTADAPILVSAYPGERPVIEGLVSIRDPSHVTLDGFNVTWHSGGYGEHMFKITGGNNWVLQNSEVWGAESFANVLITGSPQNWTIRANVIHDTYGGEPDGTRSHNLYVNAPNGTDGLIEGNILRNAPMGYNAKLSGSSMGTDGTDNVRFIGNTLTNANRANLLLGNDASDNVIEGNVFSTSNDGWAIRLWDLRGSGNVIRNNVYANATLCNDYESSVTCGQVVGTGNIQQ